MALFLTRRVSRPTVNLFARRTVANSSCHRCTLTYIVRKFLECLVINCQPLINYCFLRAETKNIDDFMSVYICILMNENDNRNNMAQSLIIKISRILS